MLRAAAVLALLALPVSAAEKDPWLRILSPNFELYTTAGERAGRDLLKHFEQVRSFFVQRFQIKEDAARQARIILFRSDREYAPYRPNEFAAAFYHAGEYRDYIVMSNATGESRPVAVHELTHMMVHQLGVELPPWLNEGLAELYSNLEPRGSQVMVGRDIPGRMRTLATEKWIDLHTLIAVDQYSPYYNERSRAGMFYAESWKLAHMLHLHPDYQPRFGEFVNALLKGDAESAFRAAYGKDLEVVQRDLQGYLSNGSISAMLFDIRIPKAVDDPRIEQDAALPARLALAEMLSNTRGRSAQAHAAYEGIARDFPGKWEVEDAMGMFAWHERKLEDASRHFARAEELGCRDGAMFLWWGRVLGYARHTSEAVTTLGKAVRFMPGSDEAALEYGNALALNGNWGTAVVTLRSVKSVPAGARWRYHYNLAYGHYRLGDVARAKAEIERALEYAATQHEKQSLDQLALAMERRSGSGVSAAADLSGDEPPRIVRREGPQVGSVEADRTAPAFPSAEGMLESVDCGKPARLHVRVDGEMRIFLISEPESIRVTGGPRGPVDLQCGPQKSSSRLRVEYEAIGASSEIAGTVRSLEFR